MSTFKYGSYQYSYQLVREDRKTISLIVKPDMSIYLKVPILADQTRIESFLKRKWSWLEKQLRFFKQYKRNIHRIEFLSGEGVLYLGRLYTLQVVKGEEESVKVVKGKIILSTISNTGNAKTNKLILDKWYKNRVRTVFEKKYATVLTRFKLKRIPELRIRKMSKRWGSYLSDNSIVLNPELIKASSECIEYVITHELCHMKYRHHNVQYYNYLEKMCPNWKSIKAKLEFRMV